MSTTGWMARALAVLAVGLGSPTADGPKTPEAWAAEIAKQIEAQEFEEALDQAALALEHWPDDTALLELASLAALENGEKDVALWYAELALAGMRAALEPNAKGKPPKVAELERRIGELDLQAGRAEALIGEYRDALLVLGKSIGKRKLYVNAVDLVTKSRDLGLEAAAEAELARIYDNKKAVEALLESGLDVPLKSKRKKRSPEQIAKEDAKHATWETAYEFKGESYTVRTDMGAELGESIVLAMEQMNRYYRRVFKVKERGGNTARVTISLYRTRAEFDEHEDNPKETVMGFFVPGANRVCTFDPREYGYALAELWSTLFHEASHQFTHLISADQIPGWLNEGTASYFEGARLRSNGSVETNLIPEERLFYLEKSLKTGSPALKDVVSYYQPGSYDGEYYPFGWGLVYFLLNYEDDACERVYVPAYQAYMESYGTGGKHDPFQRFVEFFVTRPKQPGVATFEDFEKRWREWMLALHALHFGKADEADELIERARKQTAHHKLDAAAESYRWALRKRPQDTLCYFELAQVLLAQKNEDAALFNFRRAWVGARTLAQRDQALGGAGSVTAEQVIAGAKAQLAKLDAEFGKAFASAENKLLEGALAAAQTYAEKELPLAALSVLDRAREACGGSAELASLRMQIRDDHEVDTTRWRRPRLSEPFPGWDFGDGWKADAGVLVGGGDQASNVLWQGSFPQRYRIEFTCKVEQIDAERGFVAFLFGAGENALQYFGVAGVGLCEVGRRTKEWTPTELVGVLDPKRLKELAFVIDIAPEMVEIHLDDRSVYSHAYAPDELAGGIGFFAQAAHVRIEDLRVRY